MWSNYVLSKIIRHSSRWDIARLCLINKKSYDKIYKNRELFGALVKVDFKEDAPVGINPVKYYWDRRLSAYGIGLNIQLTLCHPATTTSVDKLTYILGGVKFLSVGANFSGFVTADSRLYVCGSPIGLTKKMDKPALITTGVKKIVCSDDKIAILDDDSNLYYYSPYINLRHILSNVKQIQKNGYRWGFNAITDDGFYSNDEFGLFEEANPIIFDNIFLELTNSGLMYKLILKINQIEQNIIFFSEDYFICQDGALYSIIRTFDEVYEDDYEEQIAFKKLADDVLFVTKFKDVDYWIDSQHQLNRHKNDQYKIIQKFNNPVIALESNNHLIGILDNAGDFYVIGDISVFRGLAPTNQTFYDAPTVILNHVHQFEFGPSNFFCIRET